MPQTTRQLRDLQRQTFNAIRRPLSSDYEMDPLQKNGKTIAPLIEKFIKPNDRLSSFERLEIYNKQYWFRLLDCLWDDHPGLRTVLGDAKFQRLCIAYLNKYPSRHFSLRNLGERLEKFLTEEPQWASPYQKLAIDLARFAWAQVLAFDEAQMPVLTPENLAGCDPAKLRLMLQPHVTLLALDYPLDDFILALKRHALRGDASNAMAGKRAKHSQKRITRPRRQRTFVAVYRQNNMLYYKRMEAAEYAIISALRDGATVARACQSSVRLRSPQAVRPGSPQAKASAKKIGQWFGHWAQLGWFRINSGKGLDGKTARGK